MVKKTAIVSGCNVMNYFVIKNATSKRNLITPMYFWPGLNIF